jgi:hypothetical protein
LRICAVFDDKDGCRVICPEHWHLATLGMPGRKDVYVEKYFFNIPEGRK